MRTFAKARASVLSYRMKNVIVYAVKRCGGAAVARRINRDLGANVLVVDELFVNDDFKFCKDAVVVAIAFPNTTVERLHKLFADMACKNDDTVTETECGLLIARSHTIRDNAKRLNIKFFDVSGENIEKTFDACVEYVKNNL